MIRWMLLLLGAGAMWAGEWPSFRGVQAGGVAEASNLPVQFGPSQNVVWKTGIERGTSSPVLNGDRLFLTGQAGDDLITYAVARDTGKVLWRGVVKRSRAEALHKLNSPASATPATDGQNVYVFFGDFGLVSYTRDGQERWRYPMGPFSNLHGMAGSPIVVGKRLIIACDQDIPSYLLALDKDSGKVLWKTERPAVVHGFATPTLFTPPGGEAQIVLPGSYVLAAYSPETGEELWTVRGLSWQIKTTAITQGDTIYVTGWAPGADAGESQPLPPFEQVVAEIDANKDGKISPEEINPSKYKHGGSWRAIDLNSDGFLDARDWTFYRARRAARNMTLAVRPGKARGDLTDTHVVWKNERFVPQVSTPVLFGGWLWVIKDGGILTNMDAVTGKTVKTGRIPGALDNYYSSPVAADGKLYIASETGKVSVIKPGAEWEVLTVNDLDEPVYATPALEDGRIYLRTAKTLYCFGKEGQGR